MKSNKALLSEARHLKDQEKYPQAIKLLQKIIISDPQQNEALEEMGDCYISLGKHNNAHKALSQAIKIDSKSANAHYLLGFLLSLERKWKKSICELQIADCFLPNNSEILRCLGWSTYNSNTAGFKKGIAILERALNLTSEPDINIMSDLAVCYLNSNFLDKSEKLLKEVIKIDPNSDQARECRNFLKIINSNSK